MSEIKHNPEDCYLALDQGGHSSRALVFDRQGNLVASAQYPVDTQFVESNRVEQDPVELLQSMVQAATEVIDRLDESHRQRIQSAGLATQRSSLVCWRRSTGEPLSPVISWQDRRADKWLQKFQQHHEAIHKTTGLYLSAHYGVSKMRWCLDHIDEVAQAYSDNDLVIGPLASYLIRQLTVNGKDLADPANASRTLLWNLSRNDWDEALLKLFDIPPSILPRCVTSYYDFGDLSLGDQKIPLQLVTGDQSAAIFAFGELQPDTAYINVGTGAFLSRVSGHNPIYGRRLLSSIVTHTGTEGTYVLEGTVNGAASALDWTEQKLGTKLTPENIARMLSQCDEPILFLNGVSGLAAPFWDADFESCFVGDGSVEQKVTAVIESICFLLLANLEEMKKLSSPPLQIQITGGVAGYDGLCQRLADVTHLPVYRPIDREATARGTAYLLAHCPEHWPEEDVGTWFKPQANAGIESRYQKWSQLMLDQLRRT